MLGKLLKYELKATGRTFLPLYGAILVIAAINRVTLLGDGLSFLDNFRNIMMLVLFSLFVALGVMTLVVLIQRFNKNLLGDEGYLMFTLPVKAHSLISSKLIVTLIWSIGSGIVAILTFLILVPDSQFWADIPEAIRLLMNEIGNPDLHRAIFIMCEMVVLGIVGYIGQILIIYGSLATTQIAKFNKHRIPAAFITFFIINTLISWLTVKVAEAFGNSMATLPELTTLMGYGIVWHIILAVVLFAGTNYILKKHLNLN
ncbi:MAG: hypothetical protein AB9856_09080 [Cellulosilyticaceae bacterium]